MAKTAKGAKTTALALTATGAGLQTAGAVVMTIPVVGWIIGGALALVGTSLQVIAALQNPERAAARGRMLEQGTTRKFASAYAKVANVPDAKLHQQIAKNAAAYQRNPTPAKLEKLAASRHALMERTTHAAINSAQQVQAVEFERIELQQKERTQKVLIFGGTSVFIAMGLLLSLRR